MLLEIFNFIHFVGLALGLGGATIAFLISRKADKNPEISLAISKIMPSVSKLIFAGLILLVVSGIALPFYVKWPLNKNLLIIKHVLVAWIFIIGIILGINMKKLNKYAPKAKEKPSSLGKRSRTPLYEEAMPEFLRAKKKIKILGTINFFLW